MGNFATKQEALCDLKIEGFPRLLVKKPIKNHASQANSLQADAVTRCGKRRNWTEKASVTSKASRDVFPHTFAWQRVSYHSLSLSRSLCLSLLSHNKAREHDWLTWVLFARQVVVVVVVFGGGFVVAFWNQQGVKVVWCKAVWRKRLSGWFWFNSWISTSSVNVKCLSPCRSTLHVTSQRRGYHATSCDIRSCHSLFCAVLECWQAWTSPRSALWAQQWTKRDACDQIVNLWQQTHELFRTNGLFVCDYHLNLVLFRCLCLSVFRGFSVIQNGYQHIWMRVCWYNGDAGILSCRSGDSKTSKSCMTNWKNVRQHD